MSATLAQVLRHFGPGYLRTHALSTPQARAWRAIVACRTAALGGQRLRCDGCGAEQWRWHLCRNRGGGTFPHSRHCPQCQARARHAWRAARLAELLDVPYCHLVFTLPHEINALAGVHARWVYNTLMQCTASPALRSRDAPKTPCATPTQDRAQRHQIASRQRWLTPPATQAILRYMVKYKASGMDRTFSALADPTRRDVLLRLKEEPGLSVSELARPFSQKLPGMMKHLDVLSDAGLITRTKTGRTVSVHLSVGPMREAMEWLERYERFWTVSIDRLVALVEEDGER